MTTYFIGHTWNNGRPSCHCYDNFPRALVIQPDDPVVYSVRMERMGTADIDGVAEKGSRVLLLDDIDELMRLFQPKVLRFVAFSIRDQDAAESITQDCFFKAYASRRQFRGDCSVKTWLIRIAFNLIRTHERGQKVRFWWKAVAVSVSPQHM